MTERPFPAVGTAATLNWAGPPPPSLPQFPLKLAPGDASTSRPESVAVTVNALPPDAAAPERTTRSPADAPLGMVATIDVSDHETMPSVFVPSVTIPPVP